MLLITTALMLEARPLREALGLRDQGTGPIPVFADERILLIVTGTGPLKASAATAWAIGTFPGIRAALNIGFAGASPEVSPLHRWHYIHSIRDQASGRLHVPDILWKHPFPETALLTVAKIMRADSGWTGLVDMEGSGFHEAARRFLPPDRLALLKWVSDPLSGTIDAPQTARIFKNALAEALPFIDQWASPVEAEAEGSEKDLLREIGRCLRLTETQRQFLRKWIRGYLARNSDPGAVMAVLPDEPPATKPLNARYFAALKDVLKG